MVAMVLHDGDSATLKGRGGDYKIEVYRPPLAPKKVPFMSISPSLLAAVVLIALILHAAAAYSLRYFDFATLEHRLRELAFLNSGVRMTLTDARSAETKEIELHYEGGLVAFVNYLDRTKTAIFEPPVISKKPSATPTCSSWVFPPVRSGRPASGWHPCFVRGCRS